jgi:D-threo-aldose 1-dehydrogenase
MSKLKAVRQNMAWHNAAIPAGLWTALKERGLLAADAPVPGAS